MVISLEAEESVSIDPSPLKIVSTNVVWWIWGFWVQDTLGLIRGIFPILSWKEYIGFL